MVGRTKQCSKCERFYTTGGNSHFNLCRFCNNDRLKEGKVRKPMKRSKRKPSGEGELFMEIWSERLHYCSNCSKYLGEEPRSFYFAHLKPKSTHPELRLDKNNISLMCLSCHTEFDAGTKERFEAKKKPTL